jgi:hypothetical protein
VSHLDQYIMLIASLPQHSSLFLAGHTPLSRIRLDQRLTMLDEADAEQLKLVLDAEEWHRLQHMKDDAATVTLAQRNLALIESPLLRKLVTDRLELRTVVSALRRRQRGDPVPAPREAWGFGRWMPIISAHWNEPGFRLENIYPWLPEANALMRQRHALGFERLLLGTFWDHLSRATEDHFFDFEAVVIYVLRWDLIARWTSYNPQRAAQRFTELMDEGLGDTVKLFDEEVLYGQ